MAHVIDYDFGISAIDSGYQRPSLAAIHLIVEGDRAAIVDTGANSSVPRAFSVAHWAFSSRMRSSDG